jgi:hypothetical protein
LISAKTEYFTKRNGLSLMHRDNPKFSFPGLVVFVFSNQASDTSNEEEDVTTNSTDDDG